jgi:HAD superfamily hydrolase (TIGR01662 family)
LAKEADADPWQQANPEADARVLSLLSPHLKDNFSLDMTQMRQLLIDHRKKAHVARLVQDVLKGLGVDHIETEVATQVFEAINVYTPKPRELLDGIKDALETLHNRGYRLHIITNRRNGKEDVRKDLDALGIGHLFLKIVSSADIDVRKPALEIFRHALNTQGISAKRAAMVGDSLEQDISGAKNLGIFTIWQPLPEQQRAIMRGIGDEETEQDDLKVTPYLRGAILPHVIIEHPSKLLSLFPDRRTE